MVINHLLNGMILQVDCHDFLPNKNCGLLPLSGGKAYGLHGRFLQSAKPGFDDFGPKNGVFYVENKTGCGCFLGEKICEISVLFLGSSKGRCEIFILFSGGGSSIFFCITKKALFVGLIVGSWLKYF